MNYQKFRDLWHDALQATRLPIPYPINPTEQINLGDMSRTYELVLFSGLHPKCEPFHIATTVEWEWDATLSARYVTTEEDMLMQIFGDFGIHENTVSPQLRIDVRLTAAVPYGMIFPIPELGQWQHFIKQTGNQLQAILPILYYAEGSICAYSDHPRAIVSLLDNGQLNLEKVTFEAWQAIRRWWISPTGFLKR